MKVTRTTAKAASAWLDKKLYKGYAKALVESRLNKKDELTQAKIAEIRKILDAHVEGGTTSQGKIVRVSWLLGAIKTAYGTELAAELTNSSSDTGETMNEEAF